MAGTVHDRTTTTQTSINDTERIEVMRPSLRHALLYLPSVVLMAGCLSLGINNSKPQSSTSSGLSDRFSVENSQAMSASGCQYDYRRYKPLIPSTSTSVLIGHGFLRDQDNMAGFARALADQGVQVVTLDFCNMRLWNGHHRRNADDMRSLAAKLAIADDIIFAGFSASALAAVLAADNTTRAILALDMVDQGDQGIRAIKALSTPLIGLSGPASSCNANHNANAMFSQSKDTTQTRLIPIQGVSHCDFESPSDWLCELICSDNSRARTEIEADRQNIIGTSIDALAPYLRKNDALADT